MTSEAFLGLMGVVSNGADFLLQLFCPSLQLYVIWFILYLFFLAQMESHQDVLGLLSISHGMEYAFFLGSTSKGI